jgi:hypothetical protein
MKIYKTSTFILCLILSACQAKPKYLYEGQQRPRKEAAIVSVIGLYPERKLSLTVKRIDGQGVSRASEVHLNPGSHKFEIHLLHDAVKTESGTTIKTLEATIDHIVEVGHTYIPQATINGNRASVFFLDKGENYPEKCNPLLLWQPQNDSVIC